MRMIVCLFTLLTLSAPVKAEPVDVELVLAADGSGSIDNDELAFQREGWARAIESDEVLSAIRNGAHGKIAVLYMEWGGPTSQHVIVDWHVVSDLESARRFGDRLRTEPRAARGYNSISAAIDFSVNLVEANAYQGLKKVIDVSGDGPNIGGPPIEVSREAAVAKGFTINALAIKRPGGSYRSPDGRPLEDYYAEAVIGGPGAFVEIANADQPFADAARRKLVLELAAAPGPRLASR
ncbi:MAG: DUF1194 domain-containing protein [Labrys sp. (in: a-proteobacteria)]